MHDWWLATGIDMIQIQYEQLCDTLRALGYPVWAKPYDLNLFGLRHPTDKPDEWDDTIGVAWTDELGSKRILCCPATVDPGLPYLLSPMNPNGTAIMAEGYHKSVWDIGKHKGYAAFVQVAPTWFYRDYNRDNVLDYKTDKKVYEVIGANLHRAHEDIAVKKVGRYSAGCQVLHRSIDLGYFLWLAQEQGRNIGTTKVSYALMSEGDIG